MANNKIDATSAPFSNAFISFAWEPQKARALVQSPAKYALYMFPTKDFFLNRSLLYKALYGRIGVEFQEVEVEEEVYIRLFFCQVLNSVYV